MCREHIPWLYKGMTFHTLRENRINIQREIGHHTLREKTLIKQFKFNIKRKRNLESDPPHHLLKKALKKALMILERH